MKTIFFFYFPALTPKGALYNQLLYKAPLSMDLRKIANQP